MDTHTRYSYEFVGVGGWVWVWVHGYFPFIHMHTYNNSEIQQGLRLLQACLNIHICCMRMYDSIRVYMH